MNHNRFSGFNMFRDRHLGLHGVYERWYFGRSVASVTHVFDTSDVLAIQMLAVMCHHTMLGNIARQLALQAETAGVSSDVIRHATEGDFAALVEFLVHFPALAKGEPFSLAAAEYMRLSRSSLPR